MRSVALDSALRVAHRLSRGEDGKETCQIYLQHGQPRLRRALLNLRAFRNVALAPGETRTVEIRLEAWDFEVSNPARAA